MSQPAEELEAAAALFPDALRAELKKRGWSQEKGAREFQVSAKTVRNWLAGEMPRLNHLVRVCVIFGWPLPFPESSADIGYSPHRAVDLWLSRFSAALERRRWPTPALASGLRLL